MLLKSMLNQVNRFFAIHQENYLDEAYQICTWNYFGTVCTGGGVFSRSGKQINSYFFIKSI